MSESSRKLREVLLLSVPPGGDTLVELATEAEQWSDKYLEWHEGLTQTVDEVTLERHREVLARVASMDESAAVTQLRESAEAPAVIGNDGTLHDATNFYAATKEIHDAARVISDATDAYLEVLGEHLDALLGDKEHPDDAPDLRPITSLARVVAAVVVGFAGEVERYREGTAELLGDLGKHPKAPEDPEDEIADHVVMMASGGHSDALIARVLGQAFPQWASSAATRAHNDAGGVSVPNLEARRVHELLTERVRKMRTQRGIAAGRDIRAGKVDPLKRFSDYVNRDQDADPEPDE